MRVRRFGGLAEAGPPSVPRERGFTLIELLLVIVILGVLAAIAIMAVGGFTDRGEVSACKSDYKSVAVAVEAHLAEAGSYPASMADLVPAYLRSAPKSAEYDIVYSTGGGSYTLTVENAGGATVGTSIDACEAL